MRSATVKSPVDLRGRGIFSGADCRAIINPAEPGTGIVFEVNRTIIQAAAGSYLDSLNCSVLSNGIEKVVVTEHLLAALWCAGVSNARIVVEGPELPNSDGAALWQYSSLLQAGTILQEELPEFTATQPLCLSSDLYSFIIYVPGPRLEVNYFFAHPELGVQTFSAEIDRQYAAENILPARSFITGVEVDAARHAGILANENEDDGIVIRDGRPNKELRFEDEYVRHKVLDLLGDLAVLPFELTGRISACRSGHFLNRALARELAEEYQQQAG